MKLVSYHHEAEGWGVVEDERIVPLAAAWPDLRTALGHGPAAIRRAADGVAERIALAEVRLRPPVPEPGKILCVGLNYASHVAEAGREHPPHPSLFVRFADSFVGSGEAVLRPPESVCFDYEGELAVVIGREARRVAAAEALGCVAGYCCLAENSVRDYQRHAAQVTPGKNFERSGSMGPWLTTAEEVGDPGGLRVMTRLNGELVQDGRVADMLYPVAEIIAYVTRFTTLRPGDVIATGTPAGVGMSRQPPLWMRHGDTLEVEIPGVGVLRNRVEDEG